MILQIHTLYIISFSSTKLNGAQPPFTLVHFHRKHRNMEVEIDRMGGEIGHEQQPPPICNKKIHEYRNYRFELPLPWPTWMRISLSRNWLTSRVSVHSLCKGQAIALQIPKANSQMIKRNFHSS